MKSNNAIKLVLISVFIFTVVNVSFGQIPPKYFWRVLPSYVTANLNGTNGYLVVGENGTVLNRTNNRTFTLLSGFPNYSFNSVSKKLNNSLTTIVGNGGIIYYCSFSNYSNWTLQTSGTSSNLYGVTMSWTNSPSLTRIAVGSGGTILQSTSTSPLINWTTWTSVASGTTQNLNSVALDTDISIIVGDNGTILRSTNKGNNWSAINSGFTNKLNSIYFLPGNLLKCWITGENGLILKSTNAGLNWVQISSGTTANLKSFIPFNVCGSNGTVLNSPDSGNTWTQMPVGTTNNLNCIMSNGIVTAGDAGKILIWDIDSSYFYRKLEGNSISTFIYNSGMFNQYTVTGNTAGFEWPKGSGKTAIFTTGLSMSAMVQGQIRQAMAYTYGEMVPGRCNNGVPFTNDTFKVYSVKKTDSPNTNPDWLNWGLMVPYGAPYVDVNSNGTYEPLIDTPGVKNASQTVFVCMTDGFTSSHNPGVGFGGGTPPLFNEVHLTAWCYSQPSYTDMQFLKYEIINKGNSPWTRTYFSFVADPDLGQADDDYIGCDTVRKLGYCYNGDNMDGDGTAYTYGAAPPAVGYILLKSAYRKYVNPGYIGFTGFIHWGKIESGFNPCEFNVSGEPLQAYRYMQGFKSDSSNWLDPTQTPRKRTKFVYPGDPETNIGWTQSKGSFHNCGNDTTGYLANIDPKGDRYFALSSGAEDLTVNPGDTQRIVMCQLIARGTNNLNSVTKLKQLSDVAINFYNTNFTIGIKQISTEIPTKFSLSQNYPNPFNPVTKIKFDVPSSLSFPNVFIGNPVQLIIYDISGREIQTLVNEKLQPGTYETTFDGSALSSGVYFYQLTSGKFRETKKLILLK